MTSGIPIAKTYIELLKSFPPRPITCEDKLIATQKVIDSLIDKGELTFDEQYYLNVLGTLVHEYEQKYKPIPDIYGIELLKALIVEFDLRQKRKVGAPASGDLNFVRKDLVPIFKAESIVSEVLSGQCNLTANQIQQLADFFHVSPAAFFESI